MLQEMFQTDWAAEKQQSVEPAYFSRRYCLRDDDVKRNANNLNIFPALMYQVIL